MNKRFFSLLGLTIISLNLGVAPVLAENNQKPSAEISTDLLSSTNPKLEENNEFTTDQSSANENQADIGTTSTEEISSEESASEESPSFEAPDNSTVESTTPSDEIVTSLDWTMFDQLVGKINDLRTVSLVNDANYLSFQEKISSGTYDNLRNHLTSMSQEELNQYVLHLQSLISLLQEIPVASSRVLTGWQVENNQTVYYDANGQKVIGLQLIEGNTYYFSNDGYMQIGWVLNNGTWYYFSTEGIMQTGWLNINQKWYYLNPQGIMVTGWVNLAGTWYYLRPGSGDMMTGWASINGTWYYLTPQSGKMVTGWLQSGNTWFYLTASGAMGKGWIQVGGTWFYLHPTNGNMLTSWVLVKGQWYYLHPSLGSMQTGWIKPGPSWYYLDNSGVMKTGWLSLGGKRYYLNSSGAMAVGNIYINNIYYHFDPNGYFVDEVWKSPSGGIQPNLAGRKNLRIDVSISNQRVYIYEGNTLIYFMVCSTGLPGMETPRGNFRIQAEKGPVFGGALGGARYYRSFLGHGVYLFHSATIDGAGNYIVSEGRKMGQKASHGCIRLPVPDAIWFYNQIPYGTPVSIHD